MPAPAELIALGRALADPELDAVILAEGNVSAAGESGSFWVKGSGVQMGSAGPEGYVEVDAGPVLAALDSGIRDEGAVRELLNSARRDPKAPAVPSTEAFMHAYLLSLPDVNIVAHCHPAAVISLASLEGGADLARVRHFPDEIVLCGPAACWVPYVAPGLPLAVEIRHATLQFLRRYDVNPKTYWLQNHGLIAVGATAAEAESAVRMAVKAARILLGALQTGRPLRPMTEEEVRQIAGWPDEHFRQRMLWGTRDGS